MTHSAAAPVTMVVPVYNEANRLNGAAFLDYLATDPTVRFLFVNDGSSDATAGVLERLRSAAPTQIEILSLALNGGKAEAVRRGLAHAFADGADLVGFLDADLAAPLSGIALLRHDLASHPEALAVIGARIKLLGRRISRSERRHYLGRLFATCASLALALPVYDTQCGLKLFRRHPAVQQALATPFRSRWIFDVELLGRLRRDPAFDLATSVREVPLEIWEEQGESRLRLRDFLRAPWELWQIYRDRR